MRIEEARRIVAARIAKCGTGDRYLRQWLEFVQRRVLSQYAQDGDCWRWTGKTSHGKPYLYAPAFMRLRSCLQPRRLVYQALVSDPGTARLLSSCTRNGALCGDPDKLSKGPRKGGRRMPEDLPAHRAVKRPERVTDGAIGEFVAGRLDVISL